MITPSITWVKNQKNVSNGMYILTSNSKKPTPIQVKNIIPIVLVKNPAAENPNPITLPLATVIHIPNTRCIRLRIIGAKTPNIKYHINLYLP